MMYIAALPVSELWLGRDLEEAALAVAACVRRFKRRAQKTSVWMACIPAEILTTYLKNKSVDFMLQQPDVSKDIILKWRVKWCVRLVLIYIRANILISRTCLIFSLFWSVYHTGSPWILTSSTSCSYTPEKQVLENCQLLNIQLSTVSPKSRMWWFSCRPVSCVRCKYTMMHQSNTTKLCYVDYCIRATCFDSYRIIFRPFSDTDPYLAMFKMRCGTPQRILNIAK